MTTKAAKLTAPQARTLALAATEAGAPRAYGSAEQKMYATLQARGLIEYVRTMTPRGERASFRITDAGRAALERVNA